MEKNIVNSRLIIAGLLITILFLIMVVRLSYIQIYKHFEYNELAINQRSSEIEIKPQRGYIFDRNLKPLTNNNTTPTIVLPKNLLMKDKLLYSKVLSHTSLSFTDLQETIKDENMILQIPLQRSFDISNYKNVFIVEIVNRYDPDNLLSHVIGHINKVDNSGKSGLELTQNEFLEQGSKSYILIEHDDKQSLVIDSIKVDDINPPLEPTSVVTKIDIDIQKAIELVMDDHEVNGSVIVSEISTGNILGMASRPNIDQEYIHMYLENQNRDLMNKSIQARYPPGSIFKIVVLLAALEDDSEIVNQEFICQGFEYVNGRKRNCSAVHGHIGLKEAFSKSCNSAFIQIGKKIGSSKIIDMAWRLNFGKKIYIGLDEENEGILPTHNEGRGPEYANISIGQGKIEATPLQVTNLLMIIANGGIQKHLRLIDGVSDDYGYIIKEYRVEEDKRVIDEDHAKLLSEYLIDVVENGTASRIDLEEYGSAGGKTGSAEARLYNRDTVHGWFAGFYPAYNPKYVITVLIEEGMSGSISAAPIFEEICKIIYWR